MSAPALAIRWLLLDPLKGSDVQDKLADRR